LPALAASFMSAKITMRMENGFVRLAIQGWGKGSNSGNDTLRVGVGIARMRERKRASPYRMTLDCERCRRRRASCPCFRRHQMYLNILEGTGLALLPAPALLRVR
jgi:hypothetical protein